MDSRGDKLLFAVAAQRDLNWQAFASALDAVFVPDEQVAPDVKHVRSSVASLGDALGHWEIVSSGSSARICIAPPVIARLPQPGRVVAVLCGSRSPDTLPAVANACRASHVEVRVFSQQHLHPYAPSRIELTADSADAIAEAARSLHIGFRSQPPAWALAVVCGSLSEYLASLPWRSEPELTWPRRDFDPGLLRFIRNSGDPIRDGLTLSAYVHPSGWARQDRLWRGAECANVDRDWGRYAVLSAQGIEVLGFDRPAGTVTVPRQVPLPRLAARAFGLCSGRPPAVKPGEGLGSFVYNGVPVSVFHTLAAKLGQHGSRSTNTEDEVAPL